MRKPTTNHTKLHKALLLFAALFVLGITERTAMADPLFFSNVSAFQNNDTTKVDLFSNPGTTLLGTNLTFSIDITGTLGAGAIDVLRITYHELGSLPVVQEFQIPLFGSVNPPFTILVSFVSPGTNPLGVAATLTVDLLNSSPDFVIPSGYNVGQSVNSQTYTFNVKPVPEPATMMALVAGLAGLGFRIRRRN